MRTFVFAFAFASAAVASQGLRGDEASFGGYGSFQELEDACGALTTCSTCLQEGSSCEWCPSTSSCTPAAANCTATAEAGPAVTDPSNCQCANPAAQFKTCETCLSSCSNLGFCPATGQCLYTPDGNNPFDSFCPASGTAGEWTTDSSNCDCTNPTSTLTTCTSCTANCGNLGWCPTDGACYAGNSSGPYNRTCASSMANGTWSQDNGQCACMQPTSDLHTCDACTNNGNCPNAFCPSTRQCLYVPGNDPAPTVNSSVCPPNEDLGVLTRDCDCSDAAFITDDSTCDGCTAQGFQWCYYQRFCAVSINGSNPCPSEGCGSSCRCLPATTAASRPDLAALVGGNENCSVCQSGYTSPSTGCNARCSPNCGDCQPTNGTSCLSKCRAGFTNFPACDQACPSNCLSCHSSTANDTLPSTACIQCADQGASSPDCTECIPGVCRGPTGMCDKPCPGTGAAFAAYAATHRNADDAGATVSAEVDVHLFGDDAPYSYCDDCKYAVGKLKDIVSITHKVFTSEEEAEIAEATAEAACLILPPPLDLYCSFDVATVASDGQILAMVTWALDAGATEVFADDLCMSIRLCPYPCSPSRSDRLMQYATIKPAVDRA